MIEPDFFLHDRKKGDCWLICSDGLHGMVKNTDLISMIDPEDLEGSADRLLNAALENGGKDNITLVLLRDDSGKISDNTESQTEDTSVPEKSAGREVTDQ